MCTWVSESVPVKHFEPSRKVEKSLYKYTPFTIYQDIYLYELKIRWLKIFFGADKEGKKKNQNFQFCLCPTKFTKTMTFGFQRQFLIRLQMYQVPQKL